jgi:oligosaccharide translocation protein RFT1
MANLVHRAFKGSLSVVGFKVLSFICTQYTLRQLDPSTLGKALIQLDLLLSSVLFFSREGFRLSNKASLAWLSLPVTSLVSLAVFGTWLSTRQTGDARTEIDYWRAGVLYCCACCIEGWGEPCILWALRDLQVGIKSSAEGCATLVKTFATLVFLQVLPDWPISALGLAQVAYAVSYTIYLYWRVGSKLSPFKREALDYSALYMTGVFTLQGIFKHALTEGDRIVLASVSSSYDQGVYAMGSAYGGMAARILLQPLEENGRLLWSRLSSERNASKSSNDSNGAAISSNGKHDDKPGNNDSDQCRAQDAKQDQDKNDMLYTSYIVLVKLVLYIGLVFSCLAVNYTSILLCLLAGRKWGDHPEAATILSAFCVYTAFLALTGSEVRQLSLVHSGIGVIFALMAPWCIGRFGTVGLVMANIVAMALRSVYSIYYAANYLKTSDASMAGMMQRILSQVLPHWLVLIAFAASFYITRLSLANMTTKVEVSHITTGSTAWMKLAVQHIAVGATGTIGILTLAYSFEGRFQRSVTQLWRSKQD